MKTNILRVDNNLVDVSSVASGPDEIPGYVSIELRSVTPMSDHRPVYVRDAPPYIARTELKPNLNKIVIEYAPLSLHDLPSEIVDMWHKFESEVVSWAERRINENQDT